MNRMVKQSWHGPQTDARAWSGWKERRAPPKVAKLNSKSLLESSRATAHIFYAHFYEGREISCLLFPMWLKFHCHCRHSFPFKMSTLLVLILVLHLATVLIKFWCSAHVQRTTIQKYETHQIIITIQFFCAIFFKLVFKLNLVLLVSTTNTGPNSHCSTGYVCDGYSLLFKQKLVSKLIVKSMHTFELQLRWECPYSVLHCLKCATPIYSLDSLERLVPDLWLLTFYCWIHWLKPLDSSWNLLLVLSSSNQTINIIVRIVHIQWHGWS